MKREALIRELRKLAREKGVEFTVNEDRGKGSHYKIRYGAFETTLKSGELSPVYVAIVKRQLGIK